MGDTDTLHSSFRFEADKSLREWLLKRVDLFICWISELDKFRDKFNAIFELFKFDDGTHAPVGSMKLVNKLTFTYLNSADLRLSAGLAAV